MKNLILFILIFFPTYGISAEYDSLNDTYELKMVPVISNKDAKDIEECKYIITNFENKKECVTKDEKDNHDKVIRNTCARQSGDAKSDFSAKKIYKTCLEERGVLDK